ncbi:type VII secretion protein EccCa [Mycobacterium avium]|uniref:FtsK/SpoIIIE family protein n=1 Tax=Mycobacterium avium subsp. hominissuis TaxID=439334 RepID=A0AAI8SSI0_MYCAV|nr:type VII secretion protein EccCa [Mycobacterium avium]BBN50810.1 putative FtsK/SpoIIIE family protein [Mycobacterium avium subsp. hominissuis]
MRISFNRPFTPVKPPRISRDEVAVPAPKEIKEGEPASKLRTIGMPVMMLVVLAGMVALMLRSGRFNPMMVMFPILMLAGMGGMMTGHAGGGGTSRAQLLADRKAQTRGLGVTREKVFDRGLSMHEGLQHAFPDPIMLPSLIGTERMWEVTPTNDGYTALRYGLGEVELAARIVAPEAPPGEFLEPVGWVQTVRFLRHHSTVSSMPLALATARFPIIGLSGDREVALGMLRAMLLHAAVTHGPDNMAMVLLTDDPDGPQWSWMKWLPHTQHPLKLDRLGSARMMYSDWSTLTANVGGKDEDDPAKIIDFTLNFDPHVEFTNDKYRHVLVVVDSTVTDKLIDSVIAPRAAVTWLMVNPPDNALTSSEGIVLRCDADRTVWRTEADKPLAEPTKVAVADQVSLTDARTIARQLAKYEVASLTSLGRQAKQSERGRDWATLMRVRDPGALDPIETWSAISRYGDKRRLRIPIGFLSNGDRLDLDLKQVAEGGTGPHGQLLGATGSGKSEFLRNLVINACVSHSPSMLNMLLVDFKGGPTFLGMGDLPHVTAVITNMEQEAHLVARMAEMIDGEIARRFDVLRSADELSTRNDVKDIRDYEQLRERGVDLPPLPSLFVIIDEFTELLAAHPDFGPLFQRIGRVGRSLGIYLLFASQNLDLSGRTSGLESNLWYKIGLKTGTPQESRALLDSSDAAYRLPGTPGHGILLGKGGDRAGELTQFYAGFTGAAYFPPASEAIVERTQTRSEEGGFVGPQAFTAIEAPLPKSEDDSVEVVGELEHTEEELENAPTIFTTVVDRLRSADFPPPYRMWLPPLEVKTLDQADPTLQHWAVPANTALPKLKVPMGLFDNPVKHSQPLWTVDTTDQNVLIIGGAQTGKSTAIKTLACSLALHNTPEQVQMYLVDYAGGGLGPLADLPHVGGVASRSEPDAINRMLSQVRTLISDRERLFREHKIGTMADYRQLRTNPEYPLLNEDRYGDVYIMIDGWDAAVAEGQVLQFRGPEVESLIVGALNYGVHLVLSTARVVMRGIEPHMKSIIELHSDTEYSRISNALAKKRRTAPGHVLASGSELQGLVALPRIDGINDATTTNMGMTALVSQIAEQFAASSAERLRTLPTSLTYEQLAVMVAEADHRSVEREGRWDPRRRLRIAFGIQEERLTPAYAEMWREPHLLIAGNSKSGKSEAIGAVYDSITRRFPGGLEEAAVIFIDPRRRHLGKISDNNLFAYVTNDDELRESVMRLWERFRIDQRDLPPNVDAETRAARSWWTGPEIFFVVDDYHLFANTRNMAEQPAFFKLHDTMAKEPLARGMHFVLARAAEELFMAINRDPILRRMIGDAVPTVMLSGNKFDGQIGDDKFENFGIPGRARYVEAGFARKGRIQCAWSGIRYSEDDTLRD